MIPVLSNLKQFLSHYYLSFVQRVDIFFNDNVYLRERS